MWTQIRKFLAERRKAWIPPIVSAVVWVAAWRGIELDPAIVTPVVALIWALLVERIPNQPTDAQVGAIVHGDVK